ncbi:ABC transporter permease [Cryptosporangium phraense]|uniref:ABC transporter permease n=1 Tax=Cryptosporangium phraense TaxID=2593070 RepID=UPI00197ACB89|nr:ABC transporter permease [Cryptosporangium phraense]
MSLIDTGTAAAPAAGPTPPARVNRTRLYYVLAAVVIAFFVVRALLGADDLTSAGAIRAALQLAVPIGLAGLGGVWTERAGVTNIGLEGMLIVGTLFGAWAGWQWGPWTGVVAGVVAGALVGALHALATVVFAVDQIVSGVAINILALGVGGVLGKVFFEGKPAASERQSPPIPDMGTWSIPGIDDPLGKLEGHHWVVISDLAGILRGVFVGLSPLTVLAILLVPLSWLILWRTGFGLRLRSCGENPTAAETLGVDVYRTKFMAVVISGAFAGLGGVYLVTVSSGTYLEGQTGGRGFIGLAAMIFGNWTPVGTAAGALLFGYTDALRLRSDNSSVPALLAFAAVALIYLAVRQMWRIYQRDGGGVLARRVAPSGVWLVAVGVFAAFVALGVSAADGWGTTGIVTLGLLIAAAIGYVGVRLGQRTEAGTLTLYLPTAVVLGVLTLIGFDVPNQFVGVTPNIATLLVLAFATQRLRMPAADGLPYRRGQG